MKAQNSVVVETPSKSFFFKLPGEVELPPTTKIPTIIVRSMTEVVLKK